MIQTISVRLVMDCEGGADSSATDGGIKQTNPIPVYSYLVSTLREQHPDFAYLHVVEPRIVGVDDIVPGVGESNDFLRDIWKGKPYVAVGGYKRDDALVRADQNDHELIMFGRMYTSNVSSSEAVAMRSI